MNRIEPRAIMLLGAISLVGLMGLGTKGSCCRHCDTPQIDFTYVPPFGSFDNLRGTTCGVAPEDYRVVVYIRVAGQYWVKPTETAPLTQIDRNCRWETDITTGGIDEQADEIRAYIVARDFAPALNDLPGNSDVIASTCAARGTGPRDGVVSCVVQDMFEFIEQQLADAGHDPIAGGLPAAYRIDASCDLPPDFVDWASYNAQLYDVCVAEVAMAAITPQRREPFIRQIADALVFAISHDPVGDNRIRDAYWSTDIRAPEPNRESPSIRDGQTHTGNAAWAIIALTHAYRATSDAGYLAAAVDLGEWIESNMRATDRLGGYYGGLLFPFGAEYKDENLQRVEWRSVEHNDDVYAAFRNLASLTGNDAWVQRADHARRFLKDPSMHECNPGYWYLGTTTGTEVNLFPHAEDAVSWTWLAGIRPCGDIPLNWAFENLRAVCDGFDGIRFSDAGGQCAVSESTAHLALAMRLAHHDAEADILIDDLRTIKASAPCADGRTIVAAPCPLDGCDTGLGALYYPAPHLAATAWTILAETGTNPFEPVEPAE
jgi:hypothetical protein